MTADVMKSAPRLARPMLVQVIMRSPVPVVALLYLSGCIGSFGQPMQPTARESASLEPHASDPRDSGMSAASIDDEDERIAPSLRVLRGATGLFQEASASFRRYLATALLSGPFECGEATRRARVVGATVLAVASAGSRASREIGGVLTPERLRKVQASFERQLDYDLLSRKSSVGAWVRAVPALSHEGRARLTAILGDEAQEARGTRSLLGFDGDPSSTPERATEASLARAAQLTLVVQVALTNLPVSDRAALAEALR